MRRWLGGGHDIKARYSGKEKLGGLVDLTRPRLALMTPLGAGAAAVLAGGRFPSVLQTLLGFVAVAIAVAGIHGLNDYVDRERDKTAWPGRPIPSGRVTSKDALFLTIGCYFASAAITWFVFNPTCFAILVLTIILGSLYSINLRKNIGYLTLPPINGLIYLGGWAAASPDTLFQRWLPWVLFLLAVLWQTGHIMIYSAIHPSNRVGGKILTESRAFIYKTDLREAAIIGFTFLVLTFFLSISLGVAIKLGLIYLFLVTGGGLLAIWNGWKFVKDSGSKEKGFKAFSSASDFMLVVRGAILITALINIF